MKHVIYSPFPVSSNATFIDANKQSGRIFGYIIHSACATCHHFSPVLSASGLLPIVQPHPPGQPVFCWCSADLLFRPHCNRFISSRASLVHTNSWLTSPSICPTSGFLTMLTYFPRTTPFQFVFCLRSVYTFHPHVNTFNSVRVPQMHTNSWLVLPKFSYL